MLFTFNELSKNLEEGIPSFFNVCFFHNLTEGIKIPQPLSSVHHPKEVSQEPIVEAMFEGRADWF